MAKKVGVREWSKANISTMTQLGFKIKDDKSFILILCSKY